jgi:hypothetical protein
MKRLTLFATAIVVLFCLSGLPLMAQGRGGGSAPNGRMMGRDARTDTMGRLEVRNNSNTPSMSSKSPEQLLSQNARLASKLQPLLPTGTNLQDAASGFKNLGQFVTALHVSHNLGIPFNQLKDKMIAGGSLGKAIHELNPNLNHKDTKAAVKKGKEEAKGDIKASNP